MKYLFLMERARASYSCCNRSSSTSYSYTSSTIFIYLYTVDSNVGKFLRVPLGGSWALSRGFFTGHYGMDFYPTSGQPDVVAAASGTVISSGWGTGMYAGYGYYAHVDHGNGYTTLYGHMQRLYVSTGQSVSKGQSLGLVGQTGVAYGIHVHFELRRGSSLGGRINPAPYISY
jgi:murein DD-endopeptidase MepM/ murein hydrolase activator NlpD